MHLIWGVWCTLISAPICNLLQIRSSAQLQIFVHMKCLTGPLPNCIHFTRFPSDMHLKLPTTAWEQHKMKGKGRNVSNKSLPPLHSLSDSKHSSFEGFQLALYAKRFPSGEKMTNIKRRRKGLEHHWASIKFLAKTVKREVMTTAELYVRKSKVSHTCSHPYHSLGCLVMEAWAPASREARPTTKFRSGSKLLHVWE